MIKRIIFWSQYLVIFILLALFFIDWTTQVFLKAKIKKENSSIYKVNSSKFRAKSLLVIRDDLRQCKH